MSEKFDIYGKIFFSDVGNFFRHLCELVLRHQMQVSNTSSTLFTVHISVLGNKCARQHKLKRVHFTEALSSVIFLVWSSTISVFFAAFYLTQDGGGQALCNNGRGDPLQALLEGALGKQAACQLWFHFQKEKKVAQNMANNGARRTYWHLFHSQLLKIEAAMAFWATAQQKTSSVVTCLVF